MPTVATLAVGMTSRRHPYRRVMFVSVVAASWIIGLFGLDRNRMSSFQLPIVVGAGLVGYWMVGALRRRIELSHDRVAPVAAEAPPCVVVRHLGEVERGVRPTPQMAEPHPVVVPPARPTPVPDLRASRARRSHPSGKRKRNYIPLTDA